MRLVEASNSHVRELMRWFDDELSLRAWGGPLFRHPFSEESFLEDVKLEDVPSYALISVSEEMIGFGQTYLKLSRGHLARLAVSPKHRRKGYGIILIEQLIQKATELFSCSEHSLYVLPDNVAARRCYQKVGFTDAAPPDKDNLHMNLPFMVRRCSDSSTVGRKRTRRA